MRNVKWLLAAGLLAATTAGCVTDPGYPGTAYNSGYSNGYYAPSGYSNGYYAPSASYYAPSSSYYAQSGYLAPRYVPRRAPNGDYDRDGIPNKYDRDANGDGIPDKYQR